MYHLNDTIVASNFKYVPTVKKKKKQLNLSISIDFEYKMITCYHWRKTCDNLSSNHDCR